MDNPGQVLKGARTSKRHYVAVVIVALLFAGLFWTGYRPWKARQNRLFAASKETHAPIVSVVKASRASGQTEIVLSASVSAVTETPLYARAEGYVKKRYADIGDRVKAGQVLLEIDTPELDEQLRQARYRYNQFKATSGATLAAHRLAKANLDLAETVLKRTKKLVEEGIFAQAELDDKQATYAVRAAELASAQANVEAAEEGKRAVNSDIERFLSLTVFKKVVAPYSGVITARNCELGTLITSASLATGREVFRLADTNDLQLMINIPQANAPAVRVGMPVRFLVSEFPGTTFQGKVVRTARSLDMTSRTLLTQVSMGNGGGKLMPGMFGEVRLVADRSTPPLLIPGDTPVIRSDGTYVAVVDHDSRVRFRKLAIGRDLGKDIEVLDGLEGNERLIVNPSDEIREGVPVVVADKSKE